MPFERLMEEVAILPPEDIGRPIGDLSARWGEPSGRIMDALDALRVLAGERTYISPEPDAHYPGSLWPMGIPVWMSTPVNTAAYEALPAGTARRIEIVDGAVTVCPAPPRRHQDMVRRLAGILEEACRPWLGVTTSADLRLMDDPLTVRRPDIVVYLAGLPDDVILRQAHCVLVVEVVTPWSATADTISKPAEYAAAGIPRYWCVSAGAEPSVRVYDLGRYAPAPVTTHQGSFATSDPFDMTIDLASLGGR